MSRASEPTEVPSVAAASAPQGLDRSAPAAAELVELAQEYGVATEFWDWQGHPVQVSAGTVLDVLAAFGLRLHSPQDVAAALVQVRARAWQRVLPDVVVVQAGEPAVVEVRVPVAAMTTVQVVVEREDGSATSELVLLEAPSGTELASLANPDSVLSPQAGAVQLDGERLACLIYQLPEDLPLGWHQLRARGADLPGRPPRAGSTAPLVVTPPRMQVPTPLTERPAWGFMTQLYSVRSRASWGLGDLGDLADLVTWSGRELGAGFILVNPLHAAQPVPPMEPSPYLPSSRRFVNPIYLRIEDIRELAYLPATDRAIVQWQAEAARSTDPQEIDRDAIWAAKRGALEMIFAVPRSLARQAAFEAFCEREGEGLRDFATWCALVETYGSDRRTWPSVARGPREPELAQVRADLAGLVTFHQWLQWCLDEQLAAVAHSARQAGMGIGVMHDLAVGVHPSGADAWALADVLAEGVTVGAPPDAFNQQGQDWSQPPWRPDRLREAGYRPFRDLVRTLLRHAGGLRVDHIIGLFRLWWVPAGRSPVDGTYVRYDHEALIGILALEAHRAGAFVVGEDLGTVEPWAREYLRERGLFGTSVLWFEQDEQGRPLPPQQWRQLCLATVTTHDLPPTAGYLAGDHVQLRDELGLLTRSREEAAADAAAREAVLAQLTQLGLLGSSPTEREIVQALHAFLALTPARLLGVSLADAVGERRTQNQPGTTDEYPNWRVPLGDASGRPLLLEDVLRAPSVRELVRAVTGAAPPAARPPA